MVTFTGWILDVLQPSLIDHIGEALDGDEIIAQHEHIMRTIRRHQPRAAQRAMHDHIAAVEAVLRRVDSIQLITRRPQANESPSQLPASGSDVTPWPEAWITQLSPR